MALLPGLLLATAIAAAAAALRLLPGLALLSPMILAVVMGIAIRTAFGAPAALHPGLGFAARRVLRLAIVLLGLQLTAAQVMALGVEGAAVVTLSLAATFLLTRWLGRVIGVERGLAELIAAGTAVCGASAIVATNTVTRAREADVAYALACVTLLGSLAMFLYPLLPALLGLSDRLYGLWAGASIHEIAQVAAAAFQHGAEAGEWGMIAKLARVMLLAPLVLALGFFASRRRNDSQDGAAARVPVPWFAFGFLAMIGLNSTIGLPAALRADMMAATGFLMAVALAALGLQTDLRALLARGPRPLLLGLASFAFMAAFSLLLLLALEP
ncbi:MAG: YeiH family protein [Reyranellaceae bacterium]